MGDAIRPSDGVLHDGGRGEHTNDDHGGADRFPRKDEDGDTVATPIDDGELMDSSVVRFINSNKEEEARMDANGKLVDDAYVGLRKEELAKFAVDPYWVRLRIILLVIVAVTWIAMLVAAIVIIVLAPKCPPRPDQEWWQTAVIYHIHPQSFKDSNGDGSGDIKGIIDKLPYLTSDKGLKVSAVNIGPMYPSPHLDFGYDVGNYQAICRHHYGTLAEFDELRRALHKAGLKLILDFVPNHTSLKHKWFVQSRNTSLVEHRDFYIWRSAREGSTNDSLTRLPPNDWTNVFGSSAWTWDDARQQYYYHTYSASEPDLNLRNDAVTKELDEALKFWLNRGVDGFRMVGVQYLFEPLNLSDELTGFESEGYELVVHWRRVIDDNKKNDGKSKSQSYPSVLIVDVDGSANQTASFSKYDNADGAHIVTNKALLRLKRDCNAQCIYDLIGSWTSNTTEAWSNWQVGTVDTSRVLTRYGDDTKYVNAINMLLLTLPGTAMLFYGDELGMKDVRATGNISSNVTWRAQLSPMLWDDSPNAGFTDANVKPWMPIADNYIDCNVGTEGAHGSGKQHVNAVRKLIALRRWEAMQWGVFQPYVVGNVLTYIRRAKGFDPVLVAINFGPTSTTVNFESALSIFTGADLKLPEEAQVVTSTYNFDTSIRLDAFKDDRTIKMEKIFLKPTEGIVLTWKPVAAEFI